MRWKIIFVNGAIVLVLAVLTYFLVAARVTNVVADPGEQKRELTRALRGADSQLALDGLRIERWLTQQAATEPVRAVYQAGTAAARSDAATKVANAVRDQAAADPTFARMAPSLVLFVDERGVGVGRNGSSLMRGDELAASYPSLVRTLESGTPRSDVWIDRQRQEQMLVSSAPVRDVEGRVRGALVVGTPLNDERLARTSEQTSGHALAFLHVPGGGPSVVAATATGIAPIQEGGPLVEVVLAASKGTNPVYAGAPVEGRLYGAVRLNGYPDSSAVILASVPASRVANLSSLLWPVFAVAGLGLGLVAIGGILLGNYVSRPIADLEEGMLTVISGNYDVRFELEHEELGGLASRINALLNSLLGVKEDGGDGREEAPAAPGPAGSRGETDRGEADGMALGRGSDAVTAEALAALSEDQYYTRLYDEYVRAKKQIGDPVDHVSLDAFRAKMRESEREMLAKHGQPVRYRAELRDGAVVLIAIPLAAPVS